ncbi:Ig-like domain-containing protein [Pseudorhodoplanes sinuspersici]|nr:Ig-like domain-containing protein [Pseudorhodoplanes sinuspersici]
MKSTALPGGGTSFSTPPTGYNDHFWYNARGTYTAGMVDAVYVQMDMRVTDPNLNLVANVGADWWRDANAPFLTDFSNNPAAGTSNWSELSTEWTTLAFYSTTTAQFLADLPPPLVGASTTEPEAKPTILSYTTDSGVAGDGITNDSTLTLSGTAKAGSSVSVYDGATKIGTATANSSGNWSFTTPQLSNAAHALTASTTDTTGKTVTSSVLNVTIDTVAPVAPKIMSFTPDTGVVGDGITTANQVTLTGTAEAGSTVKVFDGTTQIGVATANTSGNWSYQTAQLTNGTHVFTATSSDVAGNTSAASAQTNVTINSSTTTTPPVTSPGQNLLVNGSFEESTVSSGTWAAFNSVPGWTAIAGGTIELWNNLNGVKATEGNNFGELDYLGARDGFYQTVKTVAGQSYELTFDARTRFAGSSSDIEVLWNNSVVATIPPGNNWSTYKFSVTGTGGQDRLTFRETSTQSVDGLGALYDNVSLVAKQSATSAASSTTTTGTNQTLDLVTQYAAANYASSGPSTGTITSTQTSPSLAPTLTQPAYHD